MSSMPMEGQPTPKSSNALTDIRTLRDRARKQIDDGVITRSYGADKQAVIKLLDEALATELVCVLRYKRHYFTASGMNAEAAKTEFLEHAQQEQEHADRIAERIVQRGGQPDLNPDTLTDRSHAEYKEGKDLKEMLVEDLVAERIAIESYREMIAFLGDKDPTTRRMLEDILMTEEEHAEDLGSLLQGF